MLPALDLVRFEPDAVVLDHHKDPVAATLRHHVDPGRSGVAHDVGHRLLDHAVESRLHRHRETFAREPARLETDREAKLGPGRPRVLSEGRLEPQGIKARRSQVRGQTVQAVDDGIGPLHELRHPSGSIPALVDLPLQQAESEAQRRQGLTRLVVKLSGNVAPLAFLRLDEAV